MVFWYKNSFLASVVSIFGSLLVTAAVAGLLSGTPAMLVCALPGVPLVLWGKKISEDKSFKKWWKQIEDKNLEPVIASDLNTAIAIYQKNPQPRTINKIATLNPSFAQHIQQNIAAKK